MEEKYTFEMLLYTKIIIRAQEKSTTKNVNVNIKKG